MRKWVERHGVVLAGVLDGGVQAYYAYLHDEEEKARNRVVAKR